MKWGLVTVASMTKSKEERENGKEIYKGGFSHQH